MLALRVSAAHADSVTRLPFVLIALGGAGIAVSTGLETVTAPYSAHVSAYPLNGAVHLLKVLSIAAFAGGMAGLVLRFHRALGTVGSIAAAALAIGTVVGSLPYTLAEVSLDPSLSPVQASIQLEAIYAGQTWISAASGIALAGIIVAIVALGVAALRRRQFPAWAPLLSLAMVPVGVGSALLADATGWPIPHPPAWVFLGLSAYGFSMLGKDAAVPLEARSRRAG